MSKEEDDKTIKHLADNLAKAGQIIMKYREGSCHQNGA